jgi:hypothetical protein
MTVHWADPRTVAEKAAGWSEGQLACRFNRFHAWPSLRHGMTVVTMGEGWYEVSQLCTRECGVARRATFNQRGYMVRGWRPDYSSDAAKRYRMLDDEGRSLGRIDKDGMAAIFRVSITGVNVTQMPG